MFSLQDRLTGQRASLLNASKWLDWNWCVNRKWLVLCARNPRELVVVRIPPRKRSPTTKGSVVVVVPLDNLCIKATYMRPQFGGSHDNEEDHLLLWLSNSDRDYFELCLVDLAQTTSSKTFTLLSSTIPRLDDLHLESGAQSFVTGGYRATHRDFVEGGLLFQPAVAGGSRQ
ncbi:hypothetical protein Pelo_9423 [Pelomyxa schiedti]|nr:hypothetical protein Pelo_9423 [Pelomyxa schiedti]